MTATDLLGLVAIYAVAVTWLLAITLGAYHDLAGRQSRARRRFDRHAEQALDLARATADRIGGGS